MAPTEATSGAVLHIGLGTVSHYPLALIMGQPIEGVYMLGKGITRKSVAPEI